VCTRETALAEKHEAMVSLGMVNTGMKDSFDLWELARNSHSTVSFSRKQSSPRAPWHAITKQHAGGSYQRVQRK
jgi:hypothetical protein